MVATAPEEGPIPLLVFTAGEIAAWRNSIAFPSMCRTLDELVKRISAYLEGKGREDSMRLDHAGQLVFAASTLRTTKRSLGLSKLYGEASKGYMIGVFPYAIYRDTWNSSSIPPTYAGLRRELDMLEVRTLRLLGRNSAHQDVLPELPAASNIVKLRERHDFKSISVAEESAS